MSGPRGQGSHSVMGSYQFKLGKGMMWSALEKDYFYRELKYVSKNKTLLTFEVPVLGI